MTMATFSERYTSNGIALVSLSTFVLCACAYAADENAAIRWNLEAGRWSAEKANVWYAEQGWRTGSNFVPSTASNQFEMWQAESWDPETIDRELGWAAAIGFNTMRVYLHDMLWTADAAGLKRMDEYRPSPTSMASKPYSFLDCVWIPIPSRARRKSPCPMFITPVGPESPCGRAEGSRPV